MALPKPGLRFRLLAILIGLASLTSLLTAGVVLTLLRQTLLDERRESGLALTRALTQGFTAFLPPEAGPGSPEAQAFFHRSMSGLAPVENLRVVQLVDSQNSLTAAFPVGQAAPPLSPADAAAPSAAQALVVTGPDGPELAVALPWPRAGEGSAAGRVEARFTLESMETQISTSAGLMILYIALSAVLLLLVGLFLLNRSLVRPVEALVAYTDRAGAGDLDTPLDISGGDEFLRLSHSLKSMFARIEQDRRRLEEHVAELTRINEELEAAQSHLIRSEKLASVGRLAAGVAHEVGNPLAAILGFVSLLQRKGDQDPKTADYLQRIEKETSRIHEILQDLLDYSRPARVELQPVSVAAVLEESIKLLGPMKRFRKAHPIIASSPDLPAASCDPRRLKQVLINLLLNAADEVPKDEPRVAAVAYAFDPGEDPEPAYRAVLAGADDAGELPEFDAPAERIAFPSGCRVVAVAVTDNGAGIAEEDLEHVFDPFFTTKEPGQGTGLGLAVSSSIVEAFDGLLLVQSRRGEGTRFQVWLPSHSRDTGVPS